MIFGRYDRMAAGVIAVHALIATMAGVSVFLIVDFVEIGNLAADTVTTGQLLTLSVMSLPRILRLMLPVAAAIGVLTGLGSLVRRREIEVLLSAGAHPARVLRAIGAIALIGALIHAASSEWLVPPSSAEVARIRRAIGLGHSGLEGYGRKQSWFRGRDRVYRVGALASASGSALDDVMMLRVQKGRLIERWDTARLSIDGDRWLASPMVHRSFHDGARPSTHRSDELALELAEAPDDFVVSIASPERLPLIELLRTTRARARLGRPVNVHLLEIGRRAAGPLTLITAMLLAAAIALRLGRRQSLAQALGAGATIGALCWVGGELSSLLGASGAVPPIAAALFVPVALTFCTALAWRRATRAGVSE